MTILEQINDSATRTTSFTCPAFFMAGAQGDLLLREILFKVPQINNRGRFFTQVMTLAITGGLNVVVKDGEIIRLEIGQQQQG